MVPTGNILAFDTTFAACSAAVRNGLVLPAAKIASRCEEMTQGHAERLMPMIEEVLEDARLGYKDLDALAVSVGPGSFTGTRVGIAAARGLALATDLPVFGATSLALIARGAKTEIQTEAGHAEAADTIEVCVDARRDQIYYQAFARSNGTAIGPATIQTARGIAEAGHAQDGRRILLGSGAAQVGDALSASDQPCILVRGDFLPSAAHLLEITLERLDPPRPLYLRPPDAKAQEGKSIARRADERIA